MITSEGSDDAPKERKTRRERFLAVAERRTVAVLDRLRLLANCANRSSYEFTEADVARIFDAIEAELERTRAAFRGKRRKVSFTLQENEGGD